MYINIRMVNPKSPKEEHNVSERVLTCRSKIYISDPLLTPNLYLIAIRLCLTIFERGTRLDKSRDTKMEASCRKSTLLAFQIDFDSLGDVI